MITIFQNCVCSVFAENSDSTGRARLWSFASIVLSILGIVTGIGVTVVWLTYWQTGFDLHIEAVRVITLFFSMGATATDKLEGIRWISDPLPFPLSPSPSHLPLLLHSCGVAR